MTISCSTWRRRQRRPPRPPPPNHRCSRSRSSTRSWRSRRPPTSLKANRWPTWRPPSRPILTASRSPTACRTNSASTTWTIWSRPKATTSGTPYRCWRTSRRVRTAPRIDWTTFTIICRRRRSRWPTCHWWPSPTTNTRYWPRWNTCQTTRSDRIARVPCRVRSRVLCRVRCPVRCRVRSQVHCQVRLQTRLATFPSPSRRRSRGPRPNAAAQRSRIKSTSGPPRPRQIRLSRNWAPPSPRPSHYTRIKQIKRAQQRYTISACRPDSICPTAGAI